MDSRRISLCYSKGLCEIRELRGLSFEIFHVPEKQLHKLFSTHIQCHFHVGGLASGVIEIGEGLALRNAAGNVYVHIMLFEGEQFGRDDRRQCEWIVQGTALDPGFIFSEFDVM